MRAKEIITEMANATRKGTDDPNVNRYFNVWPGNKLGNVLNNTGRNGHYPQTVDKTKFDSLEELNNAIKEFERSRGKIYWTNEKERNNARAFGVLELVNEKNKTVYVGKLLPSTDLMYQTRPPYVHDKNDSVPGMFDTAALTKLGYVYGRSKTTTYDKTKLRNLSNTAIATGDWSAYEDYIRNPNKVTTQPDQSKIGQSKSAQSHGFEPADILNPLTNLTVSDVVSQIERKYQNTIPSLVEVTKLVASGKPGPYPLPDMEVNKFATQFCEILQPLAIASGGLPIEGYDTKNSLLTFNASRSAKGWDSKLTMTTGKELNVSTKNNVGFNSTIATFDKFIDKLSTSEEKSFKNEIETLKTLMVAPIKPNKENMGLLKLAADLKVISYSDAKYIANLYTNLNTGDQRRTHGKEFEMPSDAPESVINYIIKGKGDSVHGLHPYHNALYYVMTMLAKKLNENSKMKELLKLLYNQSNSVLISTIIDRNSFRFVRKNADINITAKPGYVSDAATKRLGFHIS